MDTCTGRTDIITIDLQAAAPQRPSGYTARGWASRKYAIDASEDPDNLEQLRAPPRAAAARHYRPRHRIFTGTPDERLLHALFELRTIMEPAAAALAAEKRNPAQLQALRRALDEMAASTLASEEGRQADRNFHSVLLEASGNPFLASLESGVAAAVNWTTVFKQRKRPLPRDPIPDHERVYEAVASRDATEARDAMAELVRLALLDTTGEDPVSLRAARRPKRPSGGSPKSRRTE